MVKRWTKVCLIGVCIVLVLMIASLGVVLFTSAESGVSWSGDAINATYLSGQTLTLPKKTLTVGETQVTASTSVALPDGTAIKTDKLYLEQTGKYTVSYTARVGNRVYGDSQDFRVVASPVITGENSSAVWAHSDTYEDDGLRVALAAGDTLTFVNLIDLSEHTSKTLGAALPLVEVYASPETPGLEDFKRLEITLTDSVDPAVYFSVRVTNYDNEKYSLINAAATGQDFTSLHTNGTIFKGSGANWHAGIEHSFYATYERDGEAYKQKNKSIRLYYESDTKKVRYDNNYENGSKVVLSDLDDPDFYNTLFGGFPSGYARLSIKADQYKSTLPARFTVKRAAGFVLDGAADFGQTTFTVDTPFDITDMPQIKTGATFTVPQATAVDGEGVACEVMTAIYSDNANITSSEVAVIDGKATFPVAGKYVLLYTAIDRGGKTTEKRIALTVADTVAPPTLTVTGGDRTGTAGTPVRLATATANDADVSVAVTCAGEDIAVNDDMFTPLKTGDFSVTFTATDPSGQQVIESYTVKVTASAAPIVLDAPMLPPYMISDGRYRLPQVTAYTFDDGGKTAVQTVATVTDRRGTFAVGEQVYIPKISHHLDFVTVAYKVGETIVYSKEIPCVAAYANVGGRKRLQIENFFVTDGFTFVKNNTMMTMTATEDEAGFTFARAVPAENFSITLGAAMTHSDYDSIRVTLTDTCDPKNFVSFYIDRRVVNIGGNVRRTYGYIRVPNGINTGELLQEAMFTAQTEAGRAVSAAFTGNAWRFNGDYTLKVGYREDGQPFTGFDGDVLCSVTLLGGKTGAKLTVSNLCGQPVSSNPNDIIAPEITVLGDYGGFTSIGGKAVVRAARVFDVLDPLSISFVSVTAPDGSFVTSDDGVKLDGVPCDREYTFTADSYGAYAVVYTAYDGSGNTRQGGYNVNVRVDTPPQASFKTEPPTVGKVGQAFVVPDLDGIDDTFTVNKTVIAPDLRLSGLRGNSNAYIPKTTGTFTVMITVMDAVGNVTVLSFDVVVEE